MSRSFLITSLFNLLYLLVQSKKIFPEGRARLYIYIYTWHTVPCFLIGLCAKTADGLARILGQPLHWISHLLSFFSFKERGRKIDRTGVRGEREKGEWNTKILLEHQFNDSVLLYSQCMMMRGLGSRWSLLLVLLTFGIGAEQEGSQSIEPEDKVVYRYRWEEDRYLYIYKLVSTYQGLISKIRKQSAL